MSVRHLFGIEPIARLVLLNLTKHIKAGLKVLVDEINSSPCFKLLLLIPLVSLSLLVVAQCPKTSFAENRPKVDTQ